MKYLAVTFSILIILFFCSTNIVYASWTAYKDVGDINVEGDFKVGYIDLDGDFAYEIIVESKHGAGSGHYIEMLRIFREKGGKDWELDLIFTIRTLDSYFDSIYNPGKYWDIISEVEFTERTQDNNGIRDIIVKSKKIHYKDSENKIIDKEEDLGIKVYKWNGEKFINSGSK